MVINGITYYYDANGNRVTGEQVIGGVKYHFASDGALQMNGSGYGIDVSKWQGNINWSQVKSVASFAIIRCAFRGASGSLQIDPMFLTNMSGAKSNGLATGVYVYSTALNEVEAVEEASLAVALVRQAGGVSLPIYIDMEDTARGQSRLSNDQRTSIINAFCATVAASGYPTGVYASKNWLTSYINTGALPGNYSIWVAQYNTSCSYAGRKNMWQYTSKGSVPGISGNVDMNIKY